MTAHRQRRSKWGKAPQAQTLGAYQHTFCSHLKRVFKQQFTKICLKMRIFLEKIKIKKAEIQKSPQRRGILP